MNIATTDFGHGDAGPAVLMLLSDVQNVAALTEAGTTRGLRCTSGSALDATRDLTSGDGPDVVDAIVVDLAVPGAGGLLAELSKRPEPIPTVVLATAAHDLAARAALSGREIWSVLASGAEPVRVLDAVDTVLGRPCGVEGHVVALLGDGDGPVVSVALESAGMKVTLVDRVQAFEELLDEVGGVDLLLVGARLPGGVDGVSLCRALRGDPRAAELPLLLVTPPLDGDRANDAAAAGADGLVQRPVDPVGLRARAVRLIRRDQTLRELAETDRLTGLANRHKIEEQLAVYAAMADRLGQPLTLCLIDLDRFKRINDAYGHPVGDAVIQTVADLLRDSFRGEDVVARWGGEELAIASLGLTQARSVHRVTKTLERLRALEFLSPDGQAFTMTFSAGVAELTSDGSTDTLEALYQAADTALYVAKEAGRDQVVAALPDDRGRAA